MKVSLLIPIYGVEKYIERCAVSLFAQTYDDIEYIFVNDCTKDNSISVLQSVLLQYPKREKKVKIIQHICNKGLAEARATALSYATGDYIFHVDSDDFLPVNSIEKLILKAQQTNADIIDGAFQTFTEERINNIINKPYHGDKKSYIKLILCRCGLVVNNIWGRLIRRSLYLNNNINTIPGVDFAEDYSVLPCLLFYAKRSYINDIVYYYRTDNNNSYVHNLTEKNFISVINARKIVYDFFKQNDTQKLFTFEIQLSLLNLYRVAEENKISKQLVSYNIELIPTFYFLYFYSFLLKSNFLYPISTIIYNCIRSFKYRKLLKNEGEY